MVHKASRWVSYFCVDINRAVELGAQFDASEKCIKECLDGVSGCESLLKMMSTGLLTLVLSSRAHS